MRNSTRRKGTLNSGSAEDGQLAHKKDTLIKRHYKIFARFTKTVNKINEINTVKEEK